MSIKISFIKKKIQFPPGGSIHVYEFFPQDKDNIYNFFKRAKYNKVRTQISSKTIPRNI